MKQVINLLKKDILSSFIFRVPSMIKDKKQRKKLYIYPFLILVIGFYVFMGVKYVLDWVEVYDSVGKGYLYMLQAFMAYTFLMLVASIPHVISNYYYSNDIKILLPLPLKPSTILFSKMLSNALGILSTALLIILPFTVKYGLFYNKSILFYLSIVLTTVFYTMVVLSVITFIIILIMSVVNRFARSKNILQFLGTLLIILLSLGLSYFMNMAGEGLADPSNIALMMVGRIENIISYMPFLKPVEMVVNGNLLGLLILVVLGFGLTYIVSKLGAGLLVKGILNGQNVIKRKKISKKGLESAYKNNSVVKEIFKKDFLEIIKTPVYLMNTFSTAIILPVAFAIPFLANGDEMGINLAEIQKLIPLFETLFSKSIIFFIFMAAGLTISLFLSISGAVVSATSITREGKNIWLMQTLPIDINKQVLARTISGFVCSILSMLPILILIVVLLKPAFYLIVGLLIGVITGAVLASIVGLWKDAGNPKLDWQTPQQAMKQNTNTLIIIYLLMGLALAAGAGTVFLVTRNISDTQMLVIGIAAIVLVNILSLVIYHFTYKRLESKLSSYGS